MSYSAGAVLLRSERPRDDGEEGGEDQKSGFRQVSKAELLMRTMSLLKHKLTYVDQVMNEEQKAREFHANPVPRAVETGGRCFQFSSPDFRAYSLNIHPSKSLPSIYCCP